ncbi:MAG: dipeptidase [Chloroflexi bacterium]|nr:dipeptidase [Chloroflexota bacterium]
MSATPPLQYAHDHRDRFLVELEEILSIPSVSTLPEHRADMERAAVWLRDHLRSMGIEAETLQTAGHPLVNGEWLEAPAAPTLLIYGHYDVQPVDPIELWRSPPFEPSVDDGSIYARGASDDKGQTMTLLNAAESLLRARGALPLNLKFLLEGEEECGSASIKTYVAQHRERLGADAVQIADSGMFAPGIPTLEAGLRGIVYTEVHVRGPVQDLHSGLYGGVAPNPLNALGHIIAGLRDPVGRITIPGFYDAVRTPEEDVLRSWRELPFDGEALRREEIGAAALIGEPEYTPLERIWARPTLDVHGVSGGFTGVGAKTVIPARASAKISMRLVPDQRAERIFDLFRDRVLSLAPPGVEVEVQLIHGDDPVLVPVDTPLVQVACEALQETFGRPVVLGRSGGSIPIVGVFKELLSLNSILMGWGLPDDNLHAPNEKMSLDNFYRGIDATIRFWEAAGAVGGTVSQD